MEIEPYHEHGLRLHWTQRDPGRRPARRAGRQVPQRRGAAGAGAGPRRSSWPGSATTRSPEKREPDAVAGDPLRWGVVDGRGARDLFSFVDPGGRDLRAAGLAPAPDGDGVGLEFDRIVDGEVVRRMTGRAVAGRVGRMPLAPPHRSSASALAAAGLARQRPPRAEEAALRHDRHRQRHRHLLSGGLADRRPALAPARRAACDEAGGCGVPDLILVVEASKGSVANVEAIAGRRGRDRLRPERRHLRRLLRHRRVRRASRRCRACGRWPASIWRACISLVTPDSGIDERGRPARHAASRSTSRARARWSTRC